MKVAGDTALVTRFWYGVVYLATAVPFFTLPFPANCVEQSQRHFGQERHEGGKIKTAPHEMPERYRAKQKDSAALGHNQVGARQGRLKPILTTS